ncbi:hypothetical protein ACFL5H_02715 [Candidatus Latescibacterota bacterium]
MQFDVARYERLISIIDKFFVQIWPERTIHPVNIMTSDNSLYPLQKPTYGVVRMGWYIIKQKILKPILGRKPGEIIPSIPLLTVIGMVLKKR